MGFGFTNVTATDVEAEDGTKVAASVLFPDDPQQRLEVWWANATSHSGIYLIVIGASRTGPRLADCGSGLRRLNWKN